MEPFLFSFLIFCKNFPQVFLDIARRGVREAERELVLAQPCLQHGVTPVKLLDRRREVVGIHHRVLDV